MATPGEGCLEINAVLDRIRFLCGCDGSLNAIDVLLSPGFCGLHAGDAGSERLAAVVKELGRRDTSSPVVAAFLQQAGRTVAEVVVTLTTIAFLAIGEALLSAGA